MPSITDITVAIASVAACCTTISFVPQAVKTIKTNDTTAISLGMYSLFTAGTILWALYGVLTDNLPILVANVITAFLASVILFYKIRGMARTRARKDALEEEFNEQ